MPSPLIMKSSLEMTGGMRFYSALIDVRSGAAIARRGWPTQDRCYLHAGLLHIRKEDGSLHQWIISDGDMDAEDWIVVA